MHNNTTNAGPHRINTKQTQQHECKLMHKWARQTLTLTLQDSYFESETLQDICLMLLCVFNKRAAFMSMFSYQSL